MNTIRIILSALPFLLILLLMAGMQWNLTRTGIAVWLCALALAVLAFGAGPSLILISQGKAVLMALDVLYIIWGAVLFYGVCDEAGVIGAIGDGLSAVIPWRGMRALTLAWVFASFVQGAGGFGVPVLVTAPLLAAMGFSPLMSVLMPCVGHAWAVTFGSLGTSFQALMTASRLPAEDLAQPAAILLGGCCLACGILVALMAARRGEFIRILPALAAIGAIMAGVQYILAVSGFWQIASLGGGLAGLAAVFLTGWFHRRISSSVPFRPERKFLLGLAGYGLLLAVILCAQWIAPLHVALQFGAIRILFPGTVTAAGYATPAEYGRVIAPFGHSGALLVYASIAAFAFFLGKGCYLRKSPGEILRRTADRALPLSVGVALLVGVSTLLSHSGMSACLAEGLSAAVGPAYPLLAPWIGGIGAFLTGSNTNSNMLFSPLQQRAATLLGYPERIMLAAQTGGGAVGSVISPGKVGMGAVAFREGAADGRIMRRLLLPIALLLIGLSAGTILMM